MFEKNPETVKIAYKHLPLRSHNMARPAALASMAANEQGKFWEYHDKLFGEQKIVPASFDRIATELELDLEKFKSDMNSRQLQQIVAQDTADAGQLGGVPTVCSRPLGDGHFAADHEVQLVPDFALRLQDRVRRVDLVLGHRSYRGQLHDRAK